ncbi:putative serine proteinase, precursor [Neoconidiobolus thromboides FSU 785]|nr:putative serine proteinase, precursor [Neoconidiobolus thromboides FSU 785]
MLGLNLHQAISNTLAPLKHLIFGRPEVRNIYSHIFKGFSAHMPAFLVDRIKKLPLVDVIEEDMVININDFQMNAPWGLARISQREPISNNKTIYKHSPNGGEGVAVYVIDTGVRITHEEFEGRAVFGKSFTEGSNTSDENGHGTHVAATVAGKTYGVAKKAQIVALKVFDASGTGSTSDIISAVDWAVKDKRGKNGNVLNMSLGGGFSMLLNFAVEKAYRKDFVIVAAAGNSDQNACFNSPASSFNVITVGATNITDHRAYFSNHGNCVNVFAPGQNIQSAWIGNDKDTKIISGTSMACPHVAGLAAYFLSQEKLKTSQVANKIKKLATKKVVKEEGFLSPNILVYNGE